MRCGFLTTPEGPAILDLTSLRPPCARRSHRRLRSRAESNHFCREAKGADAARIYNRRQINAPERDRTLAGALTWPLASTAVVAALLTKGKACLELLPSWWIATRSTPTWRVRRCAC